MHNEHAIKDAVRERYGALAATHGPCQGSRNDPKGAGRACGASYSPEELASLDPAVVTMSLGCGNPTRLAEISPGEVVLDLGSGGGIDVFLAARRVGPTGRAIGIDMTGEMLDRARREAEDMAIANVEFRQGDIEALPLQDESVDVVISNCVINLAPDKSQVFREALRVLRPGGRMVVSDVVSNGPLPASIRTDPETWARCVGGALEEDAYLELIRAAGFREVDVLARQGEATQGEVYSVSVRARKADSQTRDTGNPEGLSMPKPLDPKTEELIAIGAALASHCEPCLRFHVRRGTEVGCTREEMQRAVEISQEVKATPARLLTRLAARLLGSSPTQEESEAPCSSGASQAASPAPRSCCG